MLEPNNFVAFTIKLCDKVKYDPECIHDKQKKVLAMYKDSALTYYHPDHPSSKILLDQLNGPVQDIVKLYFSCKVIEKDRMCCC